MWNMCSNHLLSTFVYPWNCLFSFLCLSFIFLFHPWWLVLVCSKELEKIQGRVDMGFQLGLALHELTKYNHVHAFCCVWRENGLQRMSTWLDSTEEVVGKFGRYEKDMAWKQNWRTSSVLTASLPLGFSSLSSSSCQINGPGCPLCLWDCRSSWIATDLILLFQAYSSIAYSSI